MGFRDLVDGIRTVKDPISVNYDMKIASESSGNQPLLFNEIIESHGQRAVTNILTRHRLCEAFDVEPGELIDILSWAMENPCDTVPVDPGSAPVLENRMAHTDISILPIPWHYREDGGRYQSSSIIIAQYGGQRNTSFHRQLLKGPDRTTVRLVPRHLRTMADQAYENNEDVPIAVVNGPDPLVLLAAAMSFNEPIDELRVASALHERLYGAKLGLVELPNGVQVPAESEYAMEARITTKLDDEGPYVDITGTVDDIRQEPVIEYDSIYHRNEPIFHALIPAGVEHMTLMGMPRAPTIKTAVSEVVTCTDVYLTDGGSGWLSSVVQIVPENSGDSMRAIRAALDGHKSMKQVIVVDTDIDVTNSTRVEWALMTR
jgi:UbiD family decarboxylase